MSAAPARGIAGGGLLGLALIGLACGGIVVVDESPGAGGGGGSSSSSSSSSTSSTTATSTTTTTTSTGPQPCTPEQQAAVAIQAMEDFTSCMSFGDWVAAGMGDLGNLVTSQGIPCGACHTSVGLDPAYDDAQKTFEWHRGPGRAFIAVATVDAACVPEVTAAPENYEAKGAPGPGNDHPGFSFASFMGPLLIFHDLTHAKWAAAGPGSCAP